MWRPPWCYVVRCFCRALSSTETAWCFSTTNNPLLWIGSSLVASQTNHLSSFITLENAQHARRKCHKGDYFGIKMTMSDVLGTLSFTELIVASLYLCSRCVQSYVQWPNVIQPYRYLLYGVGSGHFTCYHKRRKMMKFRPKTENLKASTS